MTLGERPDHATPGPPVLRPAVDEEDRGRAARARRGDVEPDARRKVDVRVADAGQVGHRRGHRRAPTRAPGPYAPPGSARSRYPYASTSRRCGVFLGPAPL